jgi:DNA-binding beta-propeller fold protein YncE
MKSDAATRATPVARTACLRRRLLDLPGRAATIVKVLLLAALLLAADNPTTLMVPPFEHTLGFNRVSRFFINMYLGRSFHLDDPEAICGAKMVEEDDPKTSGDDHILTMFAVNSGTGQIVYNVRLVEPRLYGKAGSDEAQFKHPHGICCNKQGDVYVADTDNDRVVKLKYYGTDLHWIRAFDSLLAAPRDVALDSRGRVYAADSGHNRIVVFDSLGNVTAFWDPGLEGPTAIAVLDANAEYNEFRVDAAVVIDRDRTRLNLLSLSGEILRQLDMRRIGLDEAAFAYCAFDYDGNVYVTDQVNDQIHVFDPALKYIVSYGRQSGTDARFDSPRGISIWRRFGQVFIVEAEGGQYYWLGLDAYMIGCYPPEFDSLRPGTTIALYVTEMADVTINITDPSGNLVRALTPPHVQRPGEVLIVWDGRDNRNELVREGEYRIDVVARPTYSRPKYILKKELTTTVRRIQNS